MKKWLWAAVALTLCSLAGVARDSDDSKKFSQAISIMAGQNHREPDAKDFRTILTLGWEGWTGRSRVFGFYLDGSLVLEQENGIALLSYGIAVRPLGRSTIDPFLQLGFTYGKASEENEYFAMPVTLGLGYWFGSGFGLKAQFRYQIFCKETMYSITAGFFFVL